MKKTKSSCKIVKKRDSEKASKPSNKPIRKQQRKGENPTQVMSTPGQSPSFGHSNSRNCKTSVCKAAVSFSGSFVETCSCHVNHNFESFDNKKDPSLWLLCTSESPRGNACGSSCHIECAFQLGIVGVVDRSPSFQLDGSYWCPVCGKVTEIIGYWKSQIRIAKRASRIKELCYRIYLCYRLLNGTSKFKELHEIVKEAKYKLETEVGPLDRVSPKGCVRKLSVANDVLRLCSLAMEKADRWLSTINKGDPEPKGTEKAGSARPEGCGDSKTCTVGPLADKRRKNASSTNAGIHDHDDTLANDSPFLISDGTSSLGKTLEDCVKIIRWLEDEGHIKREFRLKFVTWFNLRSTDQERGVVSTFIQTLIDDPTSLAEQLVDAFSDIIKQGAQK